MTYIHPLAYALPQSLAAHHDLSAERARQARGIPFATQRVPGHADQFDHQIEGAEEAAPIHEEARQKRQPRERRQRHLEDESTEKGEEAEHIDLKA